MSQQEQPTERGTEQPLRQKRRWKWARRILFVLCIVVVLAVVGVLIFGAVMRHRVSQRQAAIRDAGYPVTTEELDEWYHPVPPEENAARVLAKAFQQMSIPDPVPEQLPLFGEAALPLPGDPLPEAQKVEIRNLLAENAAALKLLHRGAAMKQARWPIDLSEGGTLTDLPHLAPLRQAASLLSLQANLTAARGEGERAAETVRTMLDLAETLRREPALISQMVRMGIKSYAVDALEEVLARTRLSDRSLSMLINDLNEAEAPSALKRAIIGERATGSTLFLHPTRAGFSRTGLATLATSEDDERWSALGLGLWASGIWPLNHVAYLGLMKANMPGASLKHPIYPVSISPQWDGTLYALAFAVYPSFNAATETLRTVRARIRAARMALAVLLYRRLTGELPRKLADLTPRPEQLPLDPFTEKPLRYKIGSGKFTVYSVGADEMDHGGVRENAEGERFEPGADIPFTVYLNE